MMPRPKMGSSAAWCRICRRISPLWRSLSVIASASQHDTQKPSRRTTANDNQPRRELPEHQCDKGHQSQPEVLRLENGTRPYRLIERSQQETDHGSINPG